LHRVGKRGGERRHEKGGGGNCALESPFGPNKKGKEEKKKGRKKGGGGEEKKILAPMREGEKKKEGEKPAIPLSYNLSRQDEEGGEVGKTERGEEKSIIVFLPPF